MSRLSGAGYALLVLIGGLLLGVSMLASLAIGAADVSLSDAVSAIWAFIFDGSSGAHRTVSEQIVCEIRLPRVVGGVLVGGALAGVGTTLQSVMRNPLAEPYILGVSSGASVGAAVAVVGGASVVGGPLASLLAFLTALASVFVVYRIAYQEGMVPAARLLLAGVALSSFTTAVTGLILYLTPEATAVRGVVFWLMGGLQSADWRSAAWMGAIAFPTLLFLFFSARWQNLLLLGDEAALSLGLDVARARKHLVGLSALAIGAVVSFAGAIGFVGLIVPHALRPLTGPDHRRLLPAAFLYGAVLLVVMDALARVIIAPEELPVGILTGVLGAPFFLAILRRLRGHAHG